MSTGIKRRDLAPCALCGHGLARANSVICYRVRVEQLVLDVRAVEREHGLEMMLGGHAALAAALSPDPDLYVRLSDEPVAQLVCADCMLSAMAAQLLGATEPCF